MILLEHSLQLNFLHQLVKQKEMCTKGEAKEAEKDVEETGVQNGVEYGGTEEKCQQNRQQSGDTAALLQRTMGALYEMNPELENNQEEIRKLDSQLDHLNDYMDKVEERLKAHNDKLMETLRQQREDREKRRRSFHERLEQSRQEDDDFQQQLTSVLSRMDSVRCKKPSVKTNDDKLPPN